MRIAQVAPLYERVPPLLYGGTERVVSYLTEELVRAGHEVTLFASGDSLTSARLRAQCPRALRLDPDCREPLARHIQMLGAVYDQADAFDIIHCHTDYLGLPLARIAPTPTMLTLHGRLDIPELGPLYAEYAEIPLVSISNAQRGPLPNAHWVATVYHGLPDDLYCFSATPEDYLLFLARISPEKRPDTAIRVARRAGMRLRIAAKIDAVDREYFQQVVRPLLDDPLIEFVGEVGEAHKNALLGGARALLFPIDWPEPFGLAMIEAFACGTPVIARRVGSVPEVVDHGATGWVCDSEDEMVDAVRRLDALDRLQCRRAFETRFSVSVMSRHYLEVYDAILAAHRRSRAGATASSPSGGGRPPDRSAPDAPSYES
jgi:glycosyltransferase involved in cell wall biosynthesis